MSSGGTAVWISAISKQKGMGYVTKYITKFQGFEDDAVDVSNELKRCRLFQRFGAWHHFVIPKLRFDNPCPQCHALVWICVWEIDAAIRKWEKSGYA